MKYMRRTAGYIWTDYKTNTQIAKELKITPILDKLLEYKRNWIQHVNRMPCNRLPRVMKRYSPTGRRNRGRPLKRLLDTWDRNGSTSGPTPWQIFLWWWLTNHTISQLDSWLIHHVNKYLTKKTAAINSKFWHPSPAFWHVTWSQSVVLGLAFYFTLFFSVYQVTVFREIAPQ